jgi:hypothetical protein
MLKHGAGQVWGGAGLPQAGAQKNLIAADQKNSFASARQL